MYERILVATDGSKHAEAAAERAIELANLTGGTLHAISVAETGILGSIRLPGESASAEEVFSKEAEGHVAAVEERAAANDVNVISEVRYGAAVEAILDYASDIDAEVVVLGSRGRGGIAQVMLGSVAEGVARYGEMDVLVVHGED